MNALRSLPLLTLAALVACSSAAPRPASPPPADATPGGDSGWTPHDPRIVRCGIDDRPRNVVGALPPPAARALLADAAPAPARRPAPATRPAPSPPDLAGDIEPEPAEIEVERLPLGSTSGTPVPASLSSVDPHYEVCLDLAPDSEPLGNVSFGLELAPNGSPLRVLPPSGDATPSPFVRCLMERACQLQATASPPGQKVSLAVPLRLHRAQSVATPAPPPPRVEPRVDVASVAPRPDRAELQLELRGSAGGSMRSCGEVPGRARVRLSLELTVPADERPRSPRRPRRIVAVAEPRNLRVTGQRTEVLEGSVSTAILGCVTNLLGQQSYSEGSLRAGSKVSEQLILTWNP